MMHGQKVPHQYVCEH